MNRRFIRFFICLGSIIFVLYSCGDGGPSKREAKEALQKQLKDCYGLVIPDTFVYTSNTNQRYLHITIAKKLNLIAEKQTLAVTPNLGGIERTLETTTAGDKFDIALSEKGKATSHLLDERGNTFFLISGHKIENIISINKIEKNNKTDKGDSKKEFEVTFSCLYKYNDLGKAMISLARDYDLKWLADDSSLRGKAILMYDDFLKSYIIKTLMWSKWNKEEWKYAVWFTDSTGKNAIYNNYENNLPQASITQEQENMKLMETAFIEQALREQSRARLIEQIQRDRAFKEYEYRNMITEKTKERDERLRAWQERTRRR